MEQIKKIIALGDTHGRNQWKAIVDKEKDSDKIIFIGDYFDTHGGGYSANRQIENFKDIIEFKKANPDNVVLLIGNHDFHYMKNARETYSGYQHSYAADIQELLEQALSDGLMQICYKHNDFFFSHAGLSKTWVEETFMSEQPNLDNMVDTINDLFKDSVYYFRFNIGINLSETGNDICQTPIWIRPESLLLDMFDGIRCVVGHTTCNKLDLNDDFPQLIMIDCIGTSGEYLVIENGIPRVGVPINK